MNAPPNFDEELDWTCGKHDRRRSRGRALMRRGASGAESQIAALQRSKSAPPELVIS